MKDLSKLEEKLDVTFKNEDFLRQALIHRSYLNEHPKFRLDHNERLEFLGDAVLELVVTENLFNKYPNPEGELTNWRAALVNAKMLAKIAGDLGINEFLFLSRGETKDVGRARQCLLANTLEAVIGAIFLDRGLKSVAKFIQKNILKELPQILKEKLYQDPKSKFQEGAQERAGITPTYEVLKESGPDHAKHFVIGVFLEKKLVAHGEGPSKQIAQEDAAKKALKKKGW